MTTKLASDSTGLDVKNHDSPIDLSAVISTNVGYDISEEYSARSKKVTSPIESETRCVSRS